MVVFIDKSFEKDLRKIGNKKLNEQVKQLIEKIQNSKSILQIGNLKKLKGSEIYYRIRLGDYRIGFELTANHEIELIRILHRKEIYRYFP